MTERYICRAFVCEGGRVTWTPDEGSQTFDHIFIQRPDSCRYAILETVRGEFLTVDMYDSYKATAGGYIGRILMGEHKVFANVEAAVMAAVLTE